MELKDYFSKQSKAYVKYRPYYPKELYDYLLSLQANRTLAWDCGTGNGQVAQVLANHFEQVIATDLSEKQIAQAKEQANIVYKVCPVEQTPIAAQSVDLITIGQALHWFNWEAFYTEVRRVAQPNAVIAAWTYVLYEVNERVDAVTYELYENILGDEYWAKERKLVEQRYASIPFPFQELTAPQLTMKIEYTFEQLMGYLSSWSGVNQYIKVNGANPLDKIVEPMAEAWGDLTKAKEVSWELYMRVGKVFG